MDAVSGDFRKPRKLGTDRKAKIGNGNMLKKYELYSTLNPVLIRSR
jgi:hypothetical protein